jgi:hypothetical protein
VAPGGKLEMPPGEFLGYDTESVFVLCLVCPALSVFLYNLFLIGVFVLCLVCPTLSLYRNTSNAGHTRHRTTQSKIDYTETLAMLDTQDIGRRHQSKID